MRLGILLTAGPGTASLQTVRQLTEAALTRGWEVALFFMHLGTLNAHRFSDLQGRPGLELTLCTVSSEQAGAAAAAGVHPGSQADWARIVEWAERVLVFG